MLIDSARASTKEGTKEWERIRSNVNAYQPRGPLGSQGPLLPIDLKDLESKILGPGDKLRKLWGKTNIYDWAKNQGEVRKPFVPSKRAASTLARVRLPGDRCPSCVATRTYMMARLTRLRDDLRKHFELLPLAIHFLELVSLVSDKICIAHIKGVDYGVTVGICLENTGVAWFDLVIMSGCVPKYNPLIFWYTGVDEVARALPRDAYISPRPTAVFQLQSRGSRCAASYAT